MGFRWLFLRWFVVLIIVALGFRYAWSRHDREESVQYEKVLLLQSASSFGLPLAGVAIDPAKREVYGLLGRPGKQVPPNFFIMWKGKDGERYGATFARTNNDITGLCKLLPDGETQTVHDVRFDKIDQPETSSYRDPSDTFRSIVHALPPESAGNGQ